MAITLIYRPFIAIAMYNKVNDGARFLEEIADREGVRLVLHQYNEMPLITPNLRNSSSRATLLPPVLPTVSVHCPRRLHARYAWRGAVDRLTMDQVNSWEGASIGPSSGTWAG